jgi:hypothetical protein
MAGINEKVLQQAQAKSEQFSNRLSSLVIKVGNLKL